MKTSSGKVSKALIFNIATVILEVFAMIVYRNRFGLPGIAFYTVISNYITLLSSVLFIISNYTGRLKKLTSIVRFTALSMLGVTFLVVILVLVWFTDPLELLFYRSNSLHHIVIPGLTFASYFFFEQHIEKRIEKLPAVILSVSYSSIMIALNALGIVEGPYPFFMVQRVGWATGILGCAGIFCVLLLIMWPFYSIPLKRK